ncbi:MAG: hypothetical protein WBB93_16860 [Saprospiraceae bacterium]
MVGLKDATLLFCDRSIVGKFLTKMSRDNGIKKKKGAGAVKVASDYQSGKKGSRNNVTPLNAINPTKPVAPKKGKS